MILGGGPNRIGQGIEFDYCCVQASIALREEGYESIMVNCNPETVSTDYDTSDRLYFEPLTLEDILHIVATERPRGVIVQFGGQTPLKLALPLKRAGVPIIGTSPEAIDRAEDRKLFSRLVERLKLRQPENGSARSVNEAMKIAGRIGYPVLVRPSYVLGGRGMQIVYDEAMLSECVKILIAGEDRIHSVLIDRFLETALEVDVDALCDGKEVVVAGIMEHIEEAGIHSGDSAMCLPPHSLSPAVIAEIENWTVRLARDLGVVGFMNIQYAVQDETLYLLEVNPRASRTVPFVSKAVGVPFAKIAAKLMIGRKLRDFSFRATPSYRSIKESVFPFEKFPGVDTILGPEMKSTGEVMGIADDFGTAFAKSQMAAGNRLPLQGTVLFSIKDADKPLVLSSARKLTGMGFSLVATSGTAGYLRSQGIEVGRLNKVAEGSPHVVDALESGKISMVVNTVEGRISLADSFSIRRTALMKRVPYFTTVAACRAAVDGIGALRKNGLTVRSLQEYHEIGKKEVALRKGAV